MLDLSYQLKRGNKSMKKVTTTITTYDNEQEQQASEQAQALELMQHIEQLNIAENTIKEAIKADKERLETIVNAVGAIENEIGTAKITKGGVSRSIDYKGLKGFSEKVYKRFVTEKPRKGGLRLNFKKVVK